MVGLGLFWLLSARKLDICDIFHTVAWHFALSDELDCDGSFYASTYSVGGSSKLVGRGLSPWSFVVWMSNQLGVIEHAA